MKLMVILAISFLATLACAATCKLEIAKKPQLDENGQPVPDENKSAFEIIDAVKSLTPLGLGIFVSNLVDYFFVLSEIIHDAHDTADFVINTAVFGVGEVIGFIIFFYIVYGIMSLFKVYGNNAKTRRHTAGWLTVVLSFMCIFLLAEQ